MNITLLNVKYSNNLGDGIIAECLETSLKRLLPNSTVISLDIGGRTTFESRDTRQSSKLMRYAKNAFLAMPPAFKSWYSQNIHSHAFNRKQVPVWRDTLCHSDACVLGGGDLLSDAWLYFPLRVDTVLRCANALELDVFVYAVGIKGTPWSREAARLFKACLTRPNITFSSVRDELSAKRWLQEIGKPVDLICRDPGLLTAETYGIRAEHSNSIGISVTSNAHESGPRVIARQAERYAAITETIVKCGLRVALFTNGAPEDERVKEAIRKRIRGHAMINRTDIQERFMQPTALVSEIARHGAILSGRLHANIVAYSLGIPHVGLNCHPKLSNFFRSTRRANWITPLETNSVSQISEAALSAIQEEINEETHTEIIRDAKNGVRTLADKLGSVRRLPSTGRPNAIYGSDAPLPETR